MSNISLGVRHAVRLALAGAAAAAASSGAYAQTAADTSTASKGLEEVVITGSRIKQSPNDVAIAPVTTVTALDVQQTGLVRTEDLLNNLPQVIAENSSGQSISADGTATVSLRGLGSSRTQVLINGRRMAPGASFYQSSSPDINQIPAELVERIDVLTGGASATYGADAVAGVVNFILNTKFEGVKIDANYGTNQHKNDNAFALNALSEKGYPLPPGTFNGGANKNFSFLLGSNFADGKGNATAYVTFLHTDPVVGSQIDYAGCTLNTPGRAPAPGQPWGPVRCGGSSSSATGRFLDFGVTANSPFATLADVTVDKTTGNLRKYTSADGYNYGALSYLQREADRYTAGAFINYDVTENLNVYSETMYARTASVAQYGPSGLFAFGTPSISCSNPLFTASELATFCTPAAIAANQALWGGTGNRITLYAARRSVESGPRLDNYSADSIRQVLGVTGKWNDTWSYDAYAQASITQDIDVQGGYLGADQINRALDVVPNPASGGVHGVPAGAPVCVSALQGYDTKCVPWNIWTPGGVTQAALDYLLIQSSYNIKATEYIMSGSITGDLGKYGWKFPTAASGVQMNVGAEHRQERYVFTPDYVFANGLASGGNGAFSKIDGGFQVGEIFGETRVPLVDGMTGIEHLGFEGGIRYSDYTTGFKTTTYKLGLEWAPVKDIRLRAAFNRAVRAPSIGDLYTPVVIGSGGTADPCWGATPVYTLQQCQRTGVTAAQYGNIVANPAAQINTAQGGNVDLKPEKANTVTVGFVLQPRILPDFAMSLDYYSIKIDRTISSLSSNTVIANCANTGDPQLCSLIHRGANTGSLWFNNSNFVSTLYQNIGTITTKGMDLTARYTLTMGTMGKLNMTLSGNRTQDWSTQPLPTGASYDCTGLAGATCYAPTPKWKHTMQANWATPWKGLDLTARWRFIGAIDVDSSSSDPQLKQDFVPAFGHIGAYSYIDLSASMPVSSHVDFRLGINNIADKAPPIVLSGNYTNCPNTTCNDNTWVGTYDTLGRYMYAHVTAKF